MLHELHFPKLNYYLDKSDPDIVILRRQDGSLVAVFSASGATSKGIVEAAKEDYRELIRAHPTSPGGRAKKTGALDPKTGLLL